MTGRNDGGSNRNDADSRHTRRQTLAGITGAASVTVAGCIDLSWSDDGTGTTFTASEAGTILEGDTPPIEWPAPVVPDASALEDALERTDELVGEVPDPLEREHVPNGVIREAIRKHRDDATAAREEATAVWDAWSDATSAERYHALRDACGMHDAARTAATAWLAIDADREAFVRELRDERDAVRKTVTDQLAAIEYRGTRTDEGRRRGALYYYQYESDLKRAERTVERWSVHEGNDVLALGESAGDLEFATTTAEIWAHFDDRYAADGDGGELETVFENALKRSIDHADEAEFPKLDSGGDEAEWLEAVGLEGIDDQGLRLDVWNAGRAVTNAREGMVDALAAGSLGTGLYRALEFEHSLRGFERFRDRIADGDLERPDNIDAIRTERAAALEAATAARDDISALEPSLGAYRLAETLRSLSWVDSAVTRAADNDPETNVSLGGEYRDYALVRAELEVLPEAIDAFRDRLLAD